MKLRFVWVGKTRDVRLRALEDEYLSRIQHHYPSEVAIAKAAHDGSDAERLAREGAEIRSKIRPGSYTIALDPAGIQIDSVEFARMMSQLASGSTRDVTFVVGGHLGMERGFLTSVNRRLALSKMTLPHELCRVLLLEQTYRACTLKNGTPYHR